MADTAKLDRNLLAISQFLAHPSVATLFQIHPNDLGLPSFEPCTEWDDWWNWSDNKENEDPWLLLLQYYSELPTAHHSTDSTRVPESLQRLIRDAAFLAVPRELGRRVAWNTNGASSERLRLSVNTDRSSLAGMSPKKAHEIFKMSQYIEVFLSSNEALKDVRKVVDIGAGQAYLSRMLRDRLGLHVLALDWSEVQTEGAAKKDARKAKRISQNRNRNCTGTLNPMATASSAEAHDQAAIQSSNRHDAIQNIGLGSQAVRSGSLTYVTTKIDAESLLSSTQVWVTPADGQAPACHHNVSTDSSESEPVPVLFVALHACGSLTVDILRAFIFANLEGERAKGPGSESSSCWKPRGAVVVGCCYNMMRPEDFPLSQALHSSIAPVPPLTPSHLQLAAQVPSQWTRSEESLGDARLAMRKVVWRALIENTLRKQREAHNDDDHSAHGSGKGDPSSGRQSGVRRLGRLNDTAYADWETFVDIVQKRMSTPLGGICRADPKLERRIEVLHALRCIVGPVVESLILLDRLAWIREELAGLPFVVEMVNLFDQAKGSGRNIAIVIRPST